MSAMFSDSGPSEDDARKPSRPAFLETEPDSFKPLEERSRSEIQSKITSLTMQAAALIDQAKVLETVPG